MEDSCTTLAHMRCSCTDGNYHGCTRVATDTYLLSYKGGPGQALRCSMVMSPPEMPSVTGLDANEQTRRTAYQDAGAYRRSGENDNNENK